MICLGLDLYEFILCGFLSTSSVCRFLYFANFNKCWDITSSNTLLVLLLLWDFVEKNVGFLLVSLRHLRLPSFFFFFKKKPFLSLFFRYSKFYWPVLKGTNFILCLLHYTIEPMWQVFHFLIVFSQLYNFHFSSFITSISLLDFLFFHLFLMNL